MKEKQSGAAHLIIIFVIIAAAVVSLMAWRLMTAHNNKQSANDSQAITWQFKGDAWQASSTPPACPDPLRLPSPVDISTATAILYPGQYRGNNYKSHGGFRFADHSNSDVTVKAPIDATLVKGSRYIEQGEVQYYFIFINDCGIMYRFDHLLTLSPEMQKYADTLPEPKVDDSRTTNFSLQPKIKAGTVLATAVGFKNTGNTSVDFGVYDLRQKNSVSKTAAWQQEHPNENEFGAYGICWLHSLANGADKAALALPAADHAAGKRSDYCQ